MGSTFFETLESRVLHSSIATAAESSVENRPLAKALSVTYEHPSDEPLGTYYGRIRVTWRAVDRPVDGYHVFRSSDNIYFEQIAEVVDPAYLDPHLQLGTKWFYKVRPFQRATGNRASLGTASAVTNLPDTQATIGCGSDGSIDVYAGNDAENVEYFRVEWTTGRGTTKTRELIADYEGGADLFPYTRTVIKGLNPRKAYTIRVFALSPLKAGSPYVQNLFSIASPVLGALQNQLDGTVRVHWENESNLATAFKLEWTPQDTPFGQFRKIVGGRRSHSALLKSLILEKNYTVRITTLVGDLFSAPSDGEVIYRDGSR